MRAFALPTEELNKGDTYQTALIRYRAITSHKDLSSNRLPKDLNSKNIRNNILRLTIYIWMHERHVVVACNYVSEGAEPFFDSLDSEAGVLVYEVL